MMKFFTAGLLSWEEKRINSCLVDLGFKELAPVRDLELEMSSMEDSIVFYSQGAKLYSLPEAKTLYVCIDSNYKQRQLANFIIENQHLLLLRPFSDQELKSFIQKLPQELEEHKARFIFLESIKGDLASSELTVAESKCQQALEVKNLRLTALLALIEIYERQNEADRMLETLQVAFQENRFHFSILLKMADSLKPFPDRNRQQEALVYDLNCLYPMDVAQYTRLFRLLISTENFKNMARYIALSEEFESNDKLRRLLVAALFVTLKYYIAKNDLTKVEEFLALFKTFSQSPKLLEDLVVYAREQDCERMIAALQTPE
jgi:hypothetical protein